MSKSGYFGNKNAEKSDAKKASSYVQVRCTDSEKKAWEAKAKSKGLKLSALIRQLLNHADT